MNEFKIFKRYMSRYLLVGLLIIISCIPFAWMAYNHIRDYTISENIAKLESGVDELENNVEKMHMISSMISDNQNLFIIEQIDGEIPANKMLYLKYLSEQMFDIQYIYDFPSMFFITFHNNDAFVSASQVSGDFNQYYGKFLEVEEMNSLEFKDMLFNGGRANSFILTKQIMYFMSGRKVFTNAVLYKEAIKNENAIATNKAVITFIIDERKIAETLLTKEALNNGLIQITDGSGNIIVNYGASVGLLDEVKDQEYVMLGNESLKILKYSKRGLNVTVGFPMSIIDNQMSEIIRLFMIYASIGIIAALLFTIVFSVYWYRPLGNMIKVVTKLGNNNIRDKNEFDYVRESLLKLVSVKDELETKMLLANAQKQAIMFENVFIKGFYRKQDEIEFLESFPIVKNGYYVVYLQVQYEDEKEKKRTALLSAVEFLEKYFQEGFIHVHSMVDTEILLIPAVDGIDEETLKKLFISMNEMLTKQFDVMCFIGISQKENEISNINVAYSQARQTVHAYKNINTSFVEHYQYINGQEKGYFDMNILTKLYEMILCEGKHEIGKIFEEIRQECLRHKERYELHKAEIYHAISFVYYTACQQVSLIPKENIKLNKYQQNHSLIQCLEILESSIYEICDKIEENKRSKKTELKDKVLEYMEQNYKRVDLTTDIMSKEIGISDKYLSTFFKEHTGKTISLYLDELRIQYAKECLENTTWSNEKIAKEAGFGATNSFYRVFKKYVGVSPSVYKKGKLEL